MARRRLMAAPRALSSFFPACAADRFATTRCCGVDGYETTGYDTHTSSREICVTRELPLLFAAWLLTSASATRAGPLEDCVLAGLRGVQSDVAARMVKQACETKARDEKSARNARIYGNVIREPLTIEAIQHGPAGVALRVRNETTLTITYVEAKWSKATAAGQCSPSFDEKSVYQTELKPGVSVQLRLPSAASFKSADKLCAVATALHGRPKSWTDSGPLVYDALPREQVATMNAELGTTYGELDPPAFMMESTSVGNTRYQSLIVVPPPEGKSKGAP